MTNVNDFAGSMKDFIDNYMPNIWNSNTGEIMAGSQVYFKDFRLSGKFPKWHIQVTDNDEEILSMGTRTGSPLYRQSAVLQVRYFVKAGQTYNDSTGSYQQEGSNDKQSLMFHMMSKLRDQLRLHQSEFFKKMKVKSGTISNEVKIPDQNVYACAMPIYGSWVQ